MAIRRIRANHVIEDEAYIQIVRRSSRMHWAVIGAVLGAFLCFFLYLFDVISSFLGFSLIIVPFISASFGFFVGEGRVVRRVAKTDLVEIKKYDWPRSVTVVLDDERFNINKDSTFRKVG